MKKSKKMKADAEKFAEEDKKKKESVEVINQAETLVYQTEKTLKEHANKVEEDVKAPIQEKVGSIKKLLEAEEKDIETIKTQTEELSKEIQKIGEAMYQAEQQNQGSDTSQDESETKKDDPIDGEVIQD